MFPYGSVPLRTYLPDGDIDLTTISSPAIEEALVSDVYTVLRGEELNEDAQFEVKDVHCIDAEVLLTLIPTFIAVPIRLKERNNVFLQKNILVPSFVPPLLVDFGFLLAG